jgi:uncharacterized protein YcaQ
VTRVTTSLTAAEARRVFLGAQGLARSRRARRVRDAHVTQYLDSQGVLQLDTVNVFARAHYVPLYARLGDYPLAVADHALWGPAKGHSAHAFEHWGHEATVMPLELLPAMHHRMIHARNWKARTRDRLEAERPGLIDEVRERVEAEGPVVAGDLEHLAPREGVRGTWWDRSHVKVALEYLFITGEVAASRGAHFARTYDSTERAWGLPRASVGGWGLSEADAQQQLFDRALAACGIGTTRDLADHFRLAFPAGTGAAARAAWAASAVERGLAEWVDVEGWEEPALLAVGEATDDAPWHRAAADPGRATAVTLVSPFDPVAWFRPRLARMFGMDYRIEIYTPAPKRVFGYYCLPFLMGDHMVGRVDLKADRKAGVLRVEAAWREETRVPGARRRSDAAVVKALADELGSAAAWLGLSRIDVSPRGNIADTLRAAVAVPA